tara:strand:+ start:699 stop:884 length:186 start_codon:yes stop_codon:yes gene_type:complete
MSYLWNSGFIFWRDLILEYIFYGAQIDYRLGLAAIFLGMHAFMAMDEDSLVMIAISRQAST